MMDNLVKSFWNKKQINIKECNGRYYPRLFYKKVNKVLHECSLLNYYCIYANDFYFSKFNIANSNDLIVFVGEAK